MIKKNIAVFSAINAMILENTIIIFFDMLCDEHSNKKDSFHPQTVYSSRVQKKGEGDEKISSL
jgi:hypothetical protein